MPGPNKWYRDPGLWLEAFVIVNLGFLALDIYLAHSVNQFHHAAVVQRYSFEREGAIETMGQIVRKHR